MQGYESVIIFDPNVTEEDQQGFLTKLKEGVEEQGGQIVRQAPWGRRKLAYPVKKRDYGIYHLLYLDRTPPALTAMERALRFEDNVIKWMSVTVEDVDGEFEKFEKLKDGGSFAQNLSER